MKEDISEQKSGYMLEYTWEYLSNNMSEYMSKSLSEYAAQNDVSEKMAKVSEGEHPW